MDNECALHNSIVSAICMPKIIKFVQIWRSSDKNKLGHFGTPCIVNFIFGEIVSVHGCMHIKSFWELCFVCLLTYYLRTKSWFGCPTFQQATAKYCSHVFAWVHAVRRGESTESQFPTWGDWKCEKWNFGTIKDASRENTRHKNTGKEKARHENTRHENARNENSGKVWFWSKWALTVCTAALKFKSSRCRYDSV